MLTINYLCFQDERLLWFKRERDQIMCREIPQRNKANEAEKRGCSGVSSIKLDKREDTHVEDVPARAGHWANTSRAIGQSCRRTLPIVCLTRKKMLLTLSLFFLFYIVQIFSCLCYGIMNESKNNLFLKIKKFYFITIFITGSFLFHYI